MSPLDAPWFAPIRPWLAQTDPRPRGHLDPAQLDRLAAQRGVRTEAGLPIRFVDACAHAEHALESAGRGAARAGYAYERVVRDTGRVPSRMRGPGMLHDWFNALSWLAYPRTKARLNRLQAEAIDAAGVGAVRGELRDAITLFDESGVLFVCADPRTAQHLRAFDWHALFVAGRERFAVAAAVHVFGHALYEKLLAPYKAICGHAWIMMADPRSPLGTLDATLAAALDAGQLRKQRLTPLPLLGVPGWWTGNEDPSFYNDPQVFRAGRRRR